MQMHKPKQVVSGPRIRTRTNCCWLRSTANICTHAHTQTHAHMHMCMYLWLKLLQGWLLGDELVLPVLAARQLHNLLCHALNAAANAKR